MPTQETHPYLQQIYSIANCGNHDNSDSMTDYFDVVVAKWRGGESIMQQAAE